MKKWLLISSIINISILLIPFSFKIDKKEKSEEIKIGNIIIVGKSKKTKNPVYLSKEVKTYNNENRNQVDILREEINPNQKETVINDLVEEFKETNNINTTENLYVDEKKLIEEDSKEENDLEKSFSNLNEISDFSEKNVETKDEKNDFYKDNMITLESSHQEIDNNILSNDLVKENSQLNYKILNMPNPEYPSKAKNLNFNKKIIVVSEFIVGKDGKVREFLLKSENELYRKYAFDKSIEKVLKEYRFTPINYEGRSVEVKFIKTFEFN